MIQRGLVIAGLLKRFSPLKIDQIGFLLRYFQLGQQSRERRLRLLPPPDLEEQPPSLYSEQIILLVLLRQVVQDLERAFRFPLACIEADQQHASIVRSVFAMFDD